MNLKRLALLFCLFSCAVLRAQNVAINIDGSAADPSAALHVKSTDKGVLVPVMTMLLRDAIPSPATGLLIFQSDGTAGFYFNAGTPASPNWKWLSTDAITTTGVTGQTLRHNGTSWEANSNLFNNPTDNNIGIGTTIPSAKLQVEIGVTGNSSNALQSITMGTGKAGLFTISNNASNANALESTTNGTGWAAAFFGSTLIRGKGNTSSTTAMRVENTSGTNLLKVFDNGNVSIGTPNALNFGGFQSVGTLVNKRGLTIASGTSYTADAPAVLELIGSATNVGEEIGMMEFIHEASNGSVYNVARITAVRENSNPTFTGLAFYTRNGANLFEKMRISTTGEVGIGCTDPNYKLHVVGDIAAQGGTLRALSATISTSITACSDIRYKKDILPLANVLPVLMQIQGITYQFKTKEFPDKYFPETSQIGFSAQEVEKYYPEVVVTDKDGYKAIDYTRFAPLLLQAVKEQQTMIDTQEKKLNQLQEEMEEMKKIMAELVSEKKRVGDR